MKFDGFNFLVLACGLSVASLAYAEPAASSFSRQLLLNKALSLPSKDIATHVLKVRFPKGYKTPLHTHEGPGPRYVVQGKLRVQDVAEDKVYQSGEVFWETGGEMTVENIGSGEAEIVIFEMVPKK